MAVNEAMTARDSRAVNMANGVRASIQHIYAMLWDIIALYEETECYSKVPKGADEDDIWKYMGNRLMEVRREVSRLFLGDATRRRKLMRIVDETEAFARSYEKPGVVKRWKRINPQIIFFDCAFDLQSEEPEVYIEIAMGLTEVQLACYPSEEMLKLRDKYWAGINSRNERDNLRYSRERIFQDELHRTLEAVFENDFALELAIPNDSSTC